MSRRRAAAEPTTTTLPKDCFLHYYFTTSLNLTAHFFITLSIHYFAASLTYCFAASQFPLFIVYSIFRILSVYRLLRLPHLVPIKDGYLLPPRKRDNRTNHGTENLALSCEFLYAVATKPLKQHNLDKKRYSNIVFHDESLDKEYSNQPISLLQDILSRPRLAWYPRIVTLGNGFGSNPEDVGSDFLIDTITRERYHQLLPPETWSRHPDKLHKTLGGADDFVALLLILLSNLESLKITHQSTKCAKRQCFMMFEKMCGLHGGPGRV